MSAFPTSDSGTPEPVVVTLTVTKAGTVPPTVTHPGVTTTPPPKHLPFTGAPVVAELDLALVIVVAGATMLTAANRLLHRA